MILHIAVDINMHLWLPSIYVDNPSPSQPYLALFTPMVPSNYIASLETPGTSVILSNITSFLPDFQPNSDIGCKRICEKKVVASSSSSLCTSPGRREAPILVGTSCKGLLCCVVYVVVAVAPLVTGWLWSWSKTYLVLVAVVFRLLVLSENISLVYTLYSPTRWRTSHSFRTCCCVSVWLPHTLHVWVRCLFLEFILTGNILVLALKMVLA